VSQEQNWLRLRKRLYEYPSSSPFSSSWHTAPPPSTRLTPSHLLISLVSICPLPSSPSLFTLETLSTELPLGRLCLLLSIHHNGRLFGTKKMAAAKRLCIGVACANPISTLQCPTCLKLGKESFFCSQDCFKTSWVTFSYCPFTSYLMGCAG